jgi:hypothetical protein
LGHNKKKKPFLYRYIKTASSNELSFLSQVVALPPCHHFELSFLSQVDALPPCQYQIYIIVRQKTSVEGKMQKMGQ